MSFMAIEKLFQSIEPLVWKVWPNFETRVTTKTNACHEQTHEHIWHWQVDCEASNRSERQDWASIVPNFEWEENICPNILAFPTMWVCPSISIHTFSMHDTKKVHRSSKCWPLAKGCGICMNICFHPPTQYCHLLSKCDWHANNLDRWTCRTCCTMFVTCCPDENEYDHHDCRCCGGVGGGRGGVRRHRHRNSWSKWLKVLISGCDFTASRTATAAFSSSSSSLRRNFVKWIFEWCMRCVCV